MSVLYYDCFAGISGDMHLAALLDLGVDYDDLIVDLAGLGLEGYGLQASRANRKGIAGAQVRVVTDPQQPPRRNLRQIEAIIGASSLKETVRGRAVAVFRRLAEADDARRELRAVEEHPAGHRHPLGPEGPCVEPLEEREERLALDGERVDVFDERHPEGRPIERREVEARGDHEGRQPLQEAEGDHDDLRKSGAST